MPARGAGALARSGARPSFAYERLRGSARSRGSRSSASSAIEDARRRRPRRSDAIDELVAELESLVARASVPREPARPADARAVPLRPAGRRAARLPERPPGARRGARHRPRAGAPAARAAHPPAGSELGPARRGSRPPRRAVRAARRRPPVRYARSGDLSIAYQVTGDGPIDLVLISGFVSHLEKDWEEPRHAHFLERLGSMARLIRFDKRGTGLSDRPRGAARPRDAHGRRARGHGRGRQPSAPSCSATPRAAPMAILFAATYPERVAGAGPLRGLRETGRPRRRLPVGGDAARRRPPTSTARSATGASESDMKRHVPRRPTTRWRAGGASACRAAASPGAIKALMRDELADRRPRACCRRSASRRSSSTAATDFDVRVEEGRYIAERIAGARFVELPGADHFVAIDPDQILDAGRAVPRRMRAAPARAPDRPGDAAHHRDRRLDGTARRARRPALARPRRAPPRGGSRRAGQVPRP